MIQHVEFNIVDFEDVQGITRTIRQCPLTQREELRLRLGKIQEQLKLADPDETLAEVYDRDPYFRFLCLRCLELNGIDRDWVNIPMLTQFLFPHQTDEGTAAEGILVQLNFPQSKRASNPTEKGMNYEEILASLWSHTEDLQKALELARSVPSGTLLDTLDARAKQQVQANPEEAMKAKRKDWQNRAREELEAQREIANGS